MKKIALEYYYYLFPDKLKNNHSFRKYQEKEAFFFTSV